MMYKVMTVGQCIIFTNTKKFAPVICEWFQKNGRNSALLSGDLTKDERDEVIRTFENG